MKIYLFLFSIVFIFSCLTKDKEKQNSYFELITKIDSLIIENNFNGVITLSKDSIDIYSNAVGFSDIENKIKLNYNDQFVIGSISKQMTAVLLLQAYEKDKLELTDTINKYLPNINQPWKNEVTVHQLLTHTHGIIDIESPLEFQAGTQFHYSQIGYELLALILEKITGKTFEFLSTELFEKHKLKNTFHPDNKKYNYLVKAYEENEKGTLTFATNSFPNFVPAGGFISNAEDLRKWNQKLHAGELVKHETLKLMSTEYSTRIHPIFEAIEYGYGLIFKKAEASIQIGALGYTPGFVCSSFYYPKSGFNLIILQNTALDLDDFKKTFIVHTEIMDLVKEFSNQ